MNALRSTPCAALPDPASAVGTPETNPSSLGALLTQAQARGLPRHEARALLRRVTACDLTQQIAHPEALLSVVQVADCKALFVRRQTGEPLAYLLGEREFYGHTFVVNPSVLIPRADTELLVDQALLCLRAPGQHAAPVPPCVLELGVGSGAVIISLALAYPTAQYVGVDISPEALVVAAKNAARHGVMNLQLLHSDLYAALPRPLSGHTSSDEGRFTLILSNPPYIAAADPHLSEGDLRYEPRSALVGGEDGLSLIRSLIEQAPDYLMTGGRLLLEHGYPQGKVCRELLRARGFDAVQSWHDLAGHERVSGGHWLRP